MSNPYREPPMQHVARLSAAEVRAAIRNFVLDRASEDKIIVKETAAKDGYEVTAEVVGPWKDES